MEFFTIFVQGRRLLFGIKKRREFLFVYQSISKQLKIVLLGATLISFSSSSTSTVIKLYLLLLLYLAV